VNTNQQFDITPYKAQFKEQLISVWEKSVRATHFFLVPSDIDYFKTVVDKIDFNAFQVFCLTRGDLMLGFLGVAERKIEMLFVAPEYIGQGFGKVLVEFAIAKLNADKVDVNEQNHSAVNFYSRLGFVVYDRMEKDSEGKDYPILQMRLRNVK
jgi:putative acetyltransferase